MNIISHIVTLRIVFCIQQLIFDLKFTTYNDLLNDAVHLHLTPTLQAEPT